jgi:hypothetical protein
MSIYARNLLKISSSLSERDPLLSYELEENVRRMMAVVNPNVSSFHNTILESQKILQNIKDQLKYVLKKHKEVIDDSTAEDFAKRMESEASNEAQILKRLLEEANKEMRRAASSRVALFGKLKDLFKKPKREEETDSDDKMEKSYLSIQHQTLYNRKYFGLVEKVKDEFLKLMKDPDKSVLMNLKDVVDTALAMGKEILRGSFLEPGSEDAPYELEQQDIEEVEEKKFVPPQIKSEKVHDSAEIRKYLSSLLKMKPGSSTYKQQLLDLYRLLDKSFGRADLESIMTASTQIAAFVSKHPRYKNDVVRVAKMALG